MGELSEPEAEQLGQHILTCSHCSGVLGSVQDRDPLIGEIQEAHRQQAANDALADHRDEPHASTPRDYSTQAGILASPAFASAKAAAGSPLEQVPGFQFLGELGRGGMGIVFKARQIGLNRLVALKMVRAGEYASNEDLIRFLAEAQAVARLQHPRIVQIFEVGRHQNRPYFVMELLEGGSLKAHLDRQPQDPRCAAQTVEGLATAVQFAHARGIVHRDLKPANILLTAEGIPKITDFGIAKCLEGGATLTETGVVLGTPSYMAPEQATGGSQKLGPGCDVYALGAILYEMLTGRPPFQAATPFETLEQVRSQAIVPPRRLQPKVPRDLETLCLKCLRKTPSERYSSAALLAEDLGRFLRDEPVLARPVSGLERLGRWCRRNPLVAVLMATVATLLVVTAVVATAAAFWFVHVAAEADQARQSEAAERRKAETALTDMYTAYGITTASRGDPARAVLWFANAARQDHEPFRRHASRVRVRSWGRQIPTPVAALPHSGQTLGDIAFDPSGKYLLAITSGKRLVIWDVALEQPLDWANGQIEAACAAWTPDGQSFVVATPPGGVEIRDFGSGKVRRTFSARGPVEAMALSQSGRLLALGGRGARVWDLTRPDFVPPELPHPGRVVALSFNQREDRLATAGDDQLARVFAIADRPGQLRPLFDPVPHRQSGLSYSFGFVKPAFVDQGRGLVTLTAKDRAGWWDAEKGNRVDTLLFRDDAGIPGDVFLLSASVDGLSFVLAGFSGAQIWDARTRKRVGKFLSHQNYVTSLAFSPDGRMVLTGGEDRRAGFWNLADGKAAAGPLMHQASLDLVAYSPDGRVAATAQRDGLVRVWAPPRGNPRNHHLHYEVHLTSARLSPDGQHVLATGAGWWPNSYRTTRVYEIATGRPSSPLLEVGGLITDATVSPDGEQVATVCSLAGTQDERFAYRVDPEGKAGRLQLWNRRTGRMMFNPLPMPSEPRGVAYSPDGSLLATICTGGQILLVDPGAGTLNRRLEHGDFLRGENSWPSVRFTPDGASFLTWGCDNKVQVWKTASGRPRYPALIHQETCYDPMISADGRLLVTCSRDNTARVWDFQSGQPIGDPLRHPDWVFSACFSRDGNYVLTACRDGAALIWNWRTRQIVQTFQHKDAVFSAAFTPEERWVVTASRDRTTCIWDRLTGKPVTPFLPFRGDVWCCMVTPGGQYAILAGGDQNVLAWSLDDLGTEHEMPVDDLCLLAEVVSGNRLQSGSDSGLTTDAWLARWREWHAKYPDYGRVDPADSDAWHRSLAREYAADGAPQAALWHLDRLIEAAPADVELRGFRARILADLDRWPEAAADFEEVAKREPENWEARYERGHALLMEGLYEAAIEDFSAALWIDRQHPVVLQERATAYLEEGRHESAISDCDLALTLDPVFAPAYYTRGIAYKKMGRTQEGEADRRRAIALDPQIEK